MPEIECTSRPPPLHDHGANGLRWRVPLRCANPKPAIVVPNCTAVAAIVPGSCRRRTGGLDARCFASSLALSNSQPSASSCSAPPPSASSFLLRPRLRVGRKPLTSVSGVAKSERCDACCNHRLSPPSERRCRLLERRCDADLAVTGDRHEAQSWTGPCVRSAARFHTFAALVPCGFWHLLPPPSPASPSLYPPSQRAEEKEMEQYERGVGFSAYAARKTMAAA